MNGVSNAATGWIIAVISLWLIVGALGKGNIGCLFSGSLCSDRLEWCYDDYAFGRCLQIYSSAGSDDKYRYDLKRHALHSLEREMQRLFALGYRWSHTYTQCVLQSLLHSIRYGLDFDREDCDHLIDQDLEAALKVLEGGEQLGPYNLAYVSFTPSASNPHPEFADEVYYPPQTEEEVEQDLMMSPGSVEVVEVEHDQPSAQGRHRFPKSLLLAKKSYAKKSGENSLRESPLSTQSILLASLLKPSDAKEGVFSQHYNTPDGFREGLETRDLGQTSDEQGMFNGREDVEGSTTLGQFSRLYNTPDSFRAGVETRDDGDDKDTVTATPKHFTRQYDTPDKFRDGFGSRDVNVVEKQGYVLPPEFVQVLSDDNEVPGDSPGIYLGLKNGLIIPEDGMVPDEFRGQGKGKIPSRLNPELEELEKGYYSTDRRLAKDPAVDVMMEDNSQRYRADSEGKAYTEGGLVYLPKQTRESEVPAPVHLQDVLDDGLDALLDEYDALDRGFKRRERLDVKKPGPYFSTNNYAFRRSETPQEQESKQSGETSNAVASVNKEEGGGDRKAAEESSAVSTEGSISHSDKDQDEDGATSFTNEKKKSMIPTQGSSQYDTVDTSYAYVGFKNGLRTWDQGVRIVEEVASLLGLDRRSLTRVKVDRNEVSFKVEPNDLGLNASDVAKKIETIKDELKKRLNIDVTTAGVGNKTKMPTALSLGPDTEHQLYVATFLLCGVISALLVAATALYVIRRHARSREKLQNLTAPDTEASKDYQELCRARMATKTQQDKPEPIHVGQRIAGLSRESEASNNSPSSRSSTSSWSEEPALTNMDISTGHMVLSYMEDHLKNKDRLEQEWVALCAYEAEPCATTVAQKAENIKKNRYPEVMPYDHARVVLNDLANISGSDYINASTIVQASLKKPLPISSILKMKTETCTVTVRLSAELRDIASHVTIFKTTDHDPRNPAYISTQGPLPHTAPDFWQMVWEQGSVVMVMLTRLTENGTAMCHRYWPEEGSELYHIYEVHLVSEHIWCDDYLVRSFYLKNLKTGETRTVTQFHFLSWPDSGVPLSTKALLEFRRKVNKSYRGRSCPIVVHCSDGVGRTGTYCLIDMVLNRMAKGAKEIDIAATLEHIRDQRPHMVKTKQQFEFVLMAVAEEVHAILKALPSQQQQPTSAGSVPTAASSQQ